MKVKYNSLANSADSSADSGRRTEDKALQLFENMFQQAPIPLGLSTIDDGRFIAVNDAFVTTLGYSRDEVVGKTGVQLGLYVNPDQHDNIVTELMATGSVSGTWSPVRRKDGSILTCSFSAKLIENHGRQQVLGMMICFTELKQAKEALRESEARLQSLFQTMTEGVVLIGPDGQIVEANPAAEHILCLTRPEITGRNYISPDWKFLRPDGTPMPMEETPGPRAMKEKRPIKDVIMGVERPDGSIAWINVSASPLLNAAGGVEGVVATFADITERRRAEQVLRESEGKYRTLVESIPQKIFLKDKNSVYISCNSNYAEDRKMKAEEISGHTD